MRKSFVFAVALTMLGSAAHAQQQPQRQTTRTWVRAYGLMYTNIDAVTDPVSGRWHFDDNAFGFGATLHREFGDGLLLGVDVSLARPKYEREANDQTSSGTASVATAMLAGRFNYGGAAALGLYLAGGLGTIAYNLGDDAVGGWNSDFALRAGTGLEYRFQPRAAVFLEWGRLWGYHEKEGVGGGRQQHSQLKLGGRFGL